MTSCPICGGTEFGPAPGNRLGRNGAMPQCSKCRSLERHRIGRLVLDTLRIRERFAGYRLLVYGLEGIAAKGWFGSAEVAPLSGPATFDPAKADRPDGCFDVIVCSHALESVPDPRSALRGLVRMLSPEGFLYLAYANPSGRRVTEDWGSPDPKQGGRYRIFGQDFEREFENLIPDTIVMRIETTDPVTDTPETCYIITKNPFWMRRVFSCELDARILDLP